MFRINNSSTVKYTQTLAAMLSANGTCGEMMQLATRSCPIAIHGLDASESPAQVVIALDMLPACNYIRS